MPPANSSTSASEGGWRLAAPGFNETSFRHRPHFASAHVSWERECDFEKRLVFDESRLKNPLNLTIFSGRSTFCICTAGTTESGELVRLYPVDYRYRERNQQFKKYQWIEVVLDPAGAGNDDRKESRRPDLNTIRLMGERLSTNHEWRDRRAIVDRLPHFTRNQLVSMHDQDKTSLGIVRPSQVLDMEIRPASADWKPEWQTLFTQLTLTQKMPTPNVLKVSIAV